MEILYGRWQEKVALARRHTPPLLLHLIHPMHATCVSNGLITRPGVHSTETQSSEGALCYATLAIILLPGQHVFLVMITRVVSQPQILVSGLDTFPYSHDLISSLSYACLRQASAQRKEIRYFAQLYSRADHIQCDSPSWFPMYSTSRSTGASSLADDQQYGTNLFECHARSNYWCSQETGTASPKTFQSFVACQKPCVMPFMPNQRTSGT